MDFLISFLIALFPTALEAGADFYDYKRGKKDKKGLDVVLRGLVCLVMGLIIHYNYPQYRLADAALLAVGIFVMFFDYIMSWLLTKRLDVLGTTSKSDRLFKRFKPHCLLIGRGIIFVLTVLNFIKLI